MGHDYGVDLRILSVTPTRDNIAAPGNRIPDKHSRLFHGKTLDEWTMLQLWSSKSISKAIFVCETMEHADRLEPMAAKYGVELMVRPKQMLHPLNDTGGLPIVWAYKQAMERTFYTLVTCPFVVSPCRPPGFFDEMTAFYCKTFGNPDWIYGYPQVTGGYSSYLTLFDVDKDGRATQVSKSHLNYNPMLRVSALNHALMATWWYEAQLVFERGRRDLSVSPIIWEIEPWMDIHIDTEDQWKEAEFWFGEKILSKGEDCYERYRSTWAQS
jgi:hypothetical protein